MLNALARDWRRYGLGISAITVGVAFVVFVGINATDPIYLALVFQGVVPGAAFVAVGIWAIKRPADLPRFLGAAAGALSAPLYYPLVGLAHPNDVGADIGRGLVGVALPVILPLNMWICATVGQRVAERRRVGLGDCAPCTWFRNGIAYVRPGHWAGCYGDFRHDLVASDFRILGRSSSGELGDRSPWRSPRRADRRARPLRVRGDDMAPDDVRSLAGHVSGGGLLQPACRPEPGQPRTGAGGAPRVFAARDAAHHSGTWRFGR